MELGASYSITSFRGESKSSNGPADYVLVVGGEVLGVIEGKKMSIGPQEVLRQAERYSKGVMISRGAPPKRISPVS